MRILLGVSGGIAAYKVAIVLRQLREQGHRVRVIPTDAALEFVGRATWEALSGEVVTTTVFEGTEQVDHVRLGREADLMVVAPATADLLSRAATGRADDLLTTTLLTVTCPVLLAPAMHTEMWAHPATRANVATLRERGVHVLDPAVGRLTGADSGAGRMPEPEEIVAAALALRKRAAGEGATGSDVPSGTGSLHGRTVAVSAGGTREALDPVRFLGNRSSGRQGVELARVAAQRGATVHLAAANVDSALLPDGVTVHPVESTAELQATMTALAADADVLVMAAAVADFRPAQSAGTKTKKRADGSVAPIELVQNPDILAGLVAARRPAQVIVGFAAETGDEHGSVLEHGRAKARRKGADLLAVNAVGQDAGFGDVPNAVHLLDSAGEQVGAASGTKHEVAEGIWDAVGTLLSERSTTGRGHAAAPRTGTVGS
ncbi:bifunctional phosphopantothenoylcysteine decarboxylase/phosphopantothenate--cysteine ligase CoaBC [Ruania albidiflava]|uniref:bifunctional phosphopantothenoylcysteine decarboxylase/phosphopantothenate--cysteine ligase CoaBC n=1 Tax=Ruania albidiflava TaxID=366586 RepID=UPI0003B68B6D|nr:bifunctional phosphopantothenoylcysteine decarboxylase/phosphopantothenate--cysteine ligase CoaBC [Ruania albidiflava]